MELFTTPIRRLWLSAVGNATAWRTLPEIVKNNVHWLSTHDLNFICLEAHKFCHDDDAAKALAETLGVVGIQCPSYRRQVIESLGVLCDDDRDYIRNYAKQSLKAMGGKSVRPFLQY